MNNKSFSRISLMVSLAIVCSVMGNYIPFLGFLNIFVGGIFLVIGLVATSISTLVIAALSYGVLSLIFLGLLGSAAMVLSFALPGLVMGFLMQRYSDDTPFFVGLVINAVGLLLMIDMVKYIGGADFLTTYQDAMDQTMEAMKEMNLQTNFPKDFSAKEMFNQFKYFFPAIVLIVSLSQSLFCKYTGLFLYKKVFPKDKVGYKPFSEFSIPEKTGIVLVISTLALYLLSFVGIMDKPYAERLMVNLIYIAIGLLFVQGVAVLLYVVKLLDGAKKTLAIIGIVLFSFYIVSALPILGIMDLFLDMRGTRFRRKK